MSEDREYQVWARMLEEDEWQAFNTPLEKSPLPSADEEEPIFASKGEMSIQIR